MPIQDVSTVFAYFNPTKSPYYSVGLAACAAITIGCEIDRSGHWLTVSIPTFLVAIALVVLALGSENQLTATEHNDQLRFARSTSISVAVLALAFTGKQVSGAQPGWLFPVSATACCLQITLFLLYSWALNQTGLPASTKNYVQLTLLTSTFLGDASYNVAQAPGGDQIAKHHLYVGLAMYGLWMACFIYWVLKLIDFGIVQKMRRPQPDPLVLNPAQPVTTV